MDRKLQTTLTRAGACLLFVLVLVWLMSSLASVTTMLMVALILAYLLNPLVNRLDSWGLGRSASAFLIVFLGLAVGVGFIVVLVPAVLGEIGRFASQAPRYLAALEEIILQAALKLNLEIPQDWNEVTGLVVEHVKRVLPGLADSTARVVTSLFKSTLELLSTAFYGLMVPVIAYYLMVSFEDMRREAQDLIPPYARKPIVEKLREIDAIIAAFIRGQLTVATCMGILYSLGFLVIGIDLALVLGLTAGALSVVPYVGSLFALVVASAMALAKFKDLLHPAYTVAWIAVVQITEGYLLTPRIVGHAIGLHPVVYILALIVAGNLFGFVGMLVAIPVTAILKVLLKTAVDAYRNSTLYKEVPGEESPQ
jgi:predicted PurR-regulated permease PerM